MPNRLWKGLTLALVCCLATCGAFASDWPQFRGPGGNATSDEAKTPLKWSATENIAWKQTLPGRGASSPIVWGDRIFLTAYTGFGTDEEAPGEKEDLRLHVICLDRNSGKIRWDETIKPSPSTQD